MQSAAHVAPRDPAWLWCEKNIELDHTSPFPGKYSTKMTPMVRTVMNAAQNNNNRRVVIMCSAQSAKTQTIMNFVAWMIRNDPGPAFWVMAAADDTKEFSKTRLMPQLESIEALKELMPTERRGRNTMLMMFTTMNLMMRGSNSKSKLQSTPVRWLILDEVRNYTKGALELVLKRVRAWWNSRTIMISTPGVKFDEIHRAYLEGNQIMFHFKCLKCGHSQPFRFGRQATIVFPKERSKGGMIWDTNDVTKPSGIWDFEELRKTVRYQCESCAAEFREADRWALNQTFHEVEHNSMPDAGTVSVWWNALYMPWIKWGDIVTEFLKADMAWKRGNLEPLKAFVCETTAEPWEEIGDRPNENELRRQCGRFYGEPYDRGAVWPDENTAMVMTVDTQAAHGGFLKYVIRQWRQTGDSRLIDYGIVLDYDELRDLQTRKKIRSDLVFLDSGYNASKVYKACMEFGWQAMKGDDRENFIYHEVRRQYRLPYKVTNVDPALGTKLQGRTSLRLILWSNPTYKDRLLLHIVLGRGPIWQIPDDVTSDYFQELMGEERQAKEDSRQNIFYEWVKVGTNDYLDCELMQLVVADLAGLAVAGEIVETEKDDKTEASASGLRK